MYQLVQILGPILFLLHVNGITNVSETLSPILFTDLFYNFIFTTLSISHSNYSHLINNLNHELESIQTLTLVNILTINIAKI